jgi:DNA-binding NtrC family response regulator
MEAQKLNLFIVDDNKSMVLALKQYLHDKFNEKLNISTFCDGESCLNNITDDTDVVILDYFLEGKNGNEILKSIKERNPGTEVIMLSSDENLETAIQSFKLGAKNYVVKSNRAWNKINKLVRSVIEGPEKPPGKFEIPVLISMVLWTFLLIGVIATVVVKLIS